MPPQIRLAGDSPTERRTKADLESLLVRYNLDRFLFTEDVVIEDGVIPHSHPVLTLSTSYPNEPALLSTYLHEQLHWWSISCPGAMDGRDEVVYEAFRDRFDLPLDHPDGCGDELSNLIHLHVCWLEMEALASLFGMEWAVARVRRIPHYKAIYTTVADERESLGDTFRAAGMGLPPPGSPVT